MSSPEHSARGRRLANTPSYKWERPAPGDSWSAEDYAAWESRNPTWPLRKDLAITPLDPDFIETVFGPQKLDYLRSQLATEPDRRNVLEQISQDADTLVLILSEAFGGKQVRPSSTPRLNYHGEYPWNPARRSPAA